MRNELSDVFILRARVCSTHLLSVQKQLDAAEEY